MRAAVRESDRLPLVRRITGGRGILHGDDLTISIVCRSSDLGVGSQVCLADLYSVYTGIFCHAFELVGVAATAGRANKCEPRTRSGDCFAVVSQADLVHRDSGVKLIGGALHRCSDVILFQASAPLCTASCKVRVRELAEFSFQGDVAAFHNCSLDPINREALENAIVTALTTQTCATILETELTGPEASFAGYIREARYRNASWIESGRSIGDLVPN